MVDLKAIKNSIDFVHYNSTHVRVLEENIDDVLGKFVDNTPNTWLDIKIDDVDENELLKFFLICESINFSFWDKTSKWKKEHDGKLYTGSYGLFYSIADGINNGIPLLDSEYLSSLTIDKASNIFRGYNTIPMLKERVNILNILGNELRDKHDLISLLSSNTSIELLNKIVDNFSNFRDISRYNKEDIYFYKRAYLLIENLKNNISSFSDIDIDNLPACADCKLPQVLRKMNILDYSYDLRFLIDNRYELSPGGIEEVEIRANTLYAIELIKKHLKYIGVNTSSCNIGNSLWLMSKDKEYKDKPYHLTRTIYY